MFIKKSFLAIILSTLLSTFSYAEDSNITIIRPNAPGMIQSGSNYGNSHSRIIDMHPENHLIPSDGAYYIGNYKRIDGSIEKDCYVKVLKSNDGLVIGTGIICSGDQN